MSVLNFKRLGHLRDEVDHLPGPRKRGENRRNHIRKTRRLLKRWEERAWRSEAEADVDE
ncbi:hypothetical protein ABZS96_26080 [Streptomyces avermitilis]|uniref:hypothetical protein n=1 Tax=Streptomyces avermitilis TaxID=33903 RepID=UPI0033B53E0F